MWSKVSLDSSGFLAQRFWSWFYKLILFDTVISGQSVTIPEIPENQTRPLLCSNRVNVLRVQLYVGATVRFVFWERSYLYIYFEAEIK